MSKHGTVASSSSSNVSGSESCKAYVMECRCRQQRDGKTVLYRRSLTFDPCLHFFNPCPYTLNNPHSLLDLTSLVAAFLS